MSRGDLGKKVEAAVAEVLKAWSQADTSFAFHRYPDARAARGALAAQPADFLVSHKGSGAFHLEVKDTSQPRRLPRQKVSQYGVLKMFWWAGINPYVLVHRSTLGNWCVLTAKELFPEGSTPPSFLMEGLATYPNPAAALREILSMEKMK